MEEQSRDSPKKFDRRKLLLGLGIAGAGAAAGLFIHKVPSLVDKIRGKKSIWRIGFEGQAYAIAPDLVVDGADDDVQVQQAVDALPSTGGKVILYGGNWVFGAKVSRAINNITFEGAGKNTYLAHDGVTNLIDAGAQTGWLIKDLRTDAGGLGGTFGTGATCLRQNVWINTTYFNDNPIALPQAGGTLTGRIFKPATTDLGSLGTAAATIDTVTYKGDFKAALTGTPTFTLRDPGGECTIQITLTAAAGPWTPVWTGAVTYGPADIDWLQPLDIPIVNTNKIIVTLKREDAADKWSGEWAEVA